MGVYGNHREHHPGGLGLSRAWQSPSALPEKMLHTWYRAAARSRLAPSRSYPCKYPLDGRAGMVCLNSASPKSRSFQGWVLPGQSPLPTSLKPCSKKGTNLGPQTVPYKPKWSLTWGTGTLGVTPMGKGSQG